MALLGMGIAEAQLVTRLEQASNGTSDAPISAVDWVSTAITAQRGHYVEGSSIPYRLAFDAILPGAHRIVIAWDTKNSGRHATDYLTHFNRLLPHNQFGAHNVPETIQPLRDVSGGPQGPVTFPIPAPTEVGSPVPGLPQNSFNALPPNQRVFHIYNGTITGAVYLSESSLTNNSAESQMRIDFVANNSPVVILFGGHLAAKSEWGIGRTAGGLQSAAYRLRLVEFDGVPSLANVAVSAPAVVSPPACDITGPDPVCPRSTNSYAAATDATGATFNWTLTENTSGASFAGPNVGQVVQVRSGTGAGAYNLQLVITQGNLQSLCQQRVGVLTNTSATPLANASVCRGGVATFNTEAAGTGPFSFVWRKGGQLLAGEARKSLVLSNVTDADAGLYCVEVMGLCNSVTNCATLSVHSNTTATAVANLTRCLGETAVFSTLPGGAGPFSYRWRKNGAEIPGQTNRIYTIGAVGFTDAGTYTVEVTGLCNAVTNSAMLMVLGLPPCGIGGLATVCPLSRGNQYTGPANMAVYRWRIVGNGTIVGPTNQQSAMVEAGGAGFFTLQLTVVNSNGCSSTCSRTINVGDIQPPVITCPANISTNTAPGQCTRAVTFNVTATDNCDGTVVTCNPASGAAFPKGTTIVNCTATDNSGNQSSCSFNVTVADLEKPTLTCPTNMVVDAELGLCEARVNYQVTVRDNCPGMSLICSPPSGTGFPVGTRSVTCRGSDAAGNIEFCSFDVTVLDHQPPQITCPKDLVFMSDPTQCDLVVDYEAEVIDNCGIAMVTCVPPSGSLFPQGITAVTCTASDASNNQSECSFQVKVDDGEKPRIVCVGDVHLSTESGRCDAVASYVPKVTDNCPGLTLTCVPPSGARFPVGQTNVTCTATDASGNTATCTFKVTVSDNERPSLVCPSDITVNADSGRCDSVVTYFAEVTDNCPGATVICLPPSGSVFPMGTTLVNCSAVDVSSNAVSCAFHVSVQDTELPTVICPADITTNCASGQCEALVQYTAAAFDACGGVELFCEPQSGSLFPLGTNSVYCVAIDTSGNVQACAFYVAVKDVERPVLTCPADFTIGTEAGRCDAVASFTATATDNCAALPVTCVPPFGTRLPKGSTSVTCSAADTSGNTASCTFRVTVQDTEPPVVNCSSNLVVNTAAGRCDATVNFVATVADNCAGATITCSPPSGASLARGVSTVSCTGTDASGNTNQCAFTVTVNDTEPPVIGCPANVVTVTEAGRCDASVTFAINAADNCGSVLTECVPPSGTRFAKGTTSVVCTATDTAGNRETCSFQVTVNDSEPPFLVCPTNVIVAAETGRCDAPVTFAPVFGDNCPGSMVACNPPAGIRFSVGQTPVTCAASDASGNTNQCSFLVTVRDQELPAVVCPSNISVSTEAGRCDAHVTFVATASDNCPGATVTCVPASGSVFALGTNVVTCIAHDASGNSSQCAFTVTVSDHESPVIDCPSDRVVATDPGRCAALINYSASVTDNCAGASVLCVPPSGSAFAKGTNVVNCTATDASGNTNGCSFIVWVIDIEKPIIACPTNVVTSTEPGRCDAVVTFSVSSFDNCSPPFTICDPPSGTRFAKGATTVRCTAADDAGNWETCSFTVRVNDMEPPALVCPTNQLLSAEAGRCDAVVTFAPTFSDNCSGATLVCSPPSGTRFVVGQTAVNCTATDASNNTNQCSFLVTVNDAERPEINCPQDIVAATESGRCDAGINFAATAADNCADATVVCVPPSGSRFPQGTTIVACTARDASGNTAACAFTVTVNDTEPPIANCPANIATNTTPGRCDAAITYVASVIDNCEGAGILCEPPSGANFPSGITTVNCVGTDTGGNTNRCSFSVTVLDREKPVVDCPQPQELFTTPGRCDAPATFEATANDNCSGVSITCVPPSGSLFATGLNTVTCTATDTTGNTENCSFTVTVRDVEPPRLICPTNMAAATDLGRCDAMVTFAASATDDCGIVMVVCVPPSGSRFPRGATLVGCTATDGSSNAVTCGFSVLVEDREKPRVICSSNLVVNTDSGWCDAVVNFDATVVDNCSGAEVMCDPPSGWVFPVGTNTVNCMAIDASGNEEGCAFQVVVLDIERPVIVCAGNIAVNTEPGRCDARVTFAPEVLDNCSGVTVSCTPSSGSRFAIGLTPVTCTAGDASGNTENCSFSVTVSDNQPPTVTCPQNMVLSTEPGMCSARALFSAQVMDNCSGASVECVPPSGSEFPLGTTSVVCRGTDVAGNTQLCAFDVRVSDTEPPRLICPPNITLNTDPTQCTARVIYVVSGDDACGLTNLVCTPPSGSLFTKGVTIVQCGADDASGNHSGCAFNVAVHDSERPTIICPTNMILAAESGRCDAVVEFGAAFSDNCPGAGAACSPPSGSTFALGTTQVNCIAADASGNTNQCSFTVRVIDTEKPLVLCSSNLVVNCETNRCDATVTYNVSCIDNCGSVPVACTPASGSRFPLGSTPVTCTATDSAGNVGTCSFTVTVRDLQKPEVQCPGSISVSASAGRCDAPVGYNVSATDNCGAVSVYCSPPGGSFFPIGTTAVSCAVVDSNSNSNSCAFTVTVRDVEPPALQCPADIWVNCATGRCDAVVAFAPQAADNCSGVNLACSPPSGAIFFKGTNIVTCTARDASSNVVSCSFKIVVRDVEQPRITCPSDMVMGTETNQCRARVTYSASVTDNCPGATVVCNPPSASYFSKGLSTVVCVATDAAGNTNRCSFSITVNDTQPPAITCPANISTNTAPGQLSTVVHFAAIATDNCPGASYVCTPQSGWVFSQGTTPVSCTATDASGNSRSCTFTVTVNDTEPPVINCPTNIIVATTAGRCDAVCNYTVTASDNSQITTVLCLPPSGSVLPKGVTNVLCTATDAASNRVSCAFSISVIDLERPVITCPTNMVLNTDKGRCDAPVTYSVRATDNCGSASLSCNPASGTLLPKGTNTVTCTATDTSGNVEICSFAVSVVDTERPVISCPANIQAIAAAGQCDAVVNYNVSAMDNCSGVSFLCSPVSGSAFPRGVTQVNCTAHDTSGNTAGCSFLVEVRDSESPVITCPSGIDINAPAGMCGAPVNYGASVRDNCPGATLSCNPPSGSTFPVGTNWVSCNAFDASGNAAVCSFRVIVRDVERPILNCPGDIVLDGNSGDCSPVATYNPTAQDNCSGATLTCVPPSGTTFPQGTNRVQCTALDRSGNMGSCSFSVIVRLQPVSATPLQSQNKCVGDSANFNTTVNGSGPIHFTWLKNGAVLAGKTNSWLAINTVAPDDAGTYSVEARGPCSSVINSATLTVNVPVTINGLTNVTRCDCDPLILSPMVTGTGPLSYLWRKNGTVIPGATSNTLAFAKLGTNDAGLYTLEVSGVCNTSSSSALITVVSVPNPAIYTNSGAITISDHAPAFPYPSSVRVTCVPRPIARATVTLRGFTHAYPDDVDVLLTGPAGQAVILMSDAGDGALANNVSITLDDSAAAALPDSTQLFTGVFRPGNYEDTLDAFPLPAPKGPAAGTLSAVTGTAANGFWSLFVIDDFQLDSGTINNGWVLRLYWESNPIRLTNPRLLPNGAFQITLLGDAQTTCVIESSGDMVTWTRVGTITLSGPETDFTDPNPAGLGFYRAVQP